MSSNEGIPPEYANHSIPSPVYNQQLHSSETLVAETYVPPPPYIQRVQTGSTSTSSTLSVGSSNSVAEQSYIYSSGNLELNLGPRPEGSPTNPSYGRNGTIFGTVKLKKLSNVQRLEVSLQGQLQTTLIQAGLPVGHSALTILDLRQVLFAPTKEDKAVSERAKENHKTFPFELQFPDVIKNRSDPLPPTFRNVHRVMEGFVKYTLHVQAIKTGLWPRDILMVTVHYLPKYYLPPDALIWPEISLMDAKRFGFECSKWKVTHCPLLQPCPLKPRFEPELCIAIPKTAQALSKTCSIINVQITAPPELLDTYVKRTSIQMIRKTTLTVMGESHSSHSGVIAKGCIQQIESELAGPNSRIIRAGVKGGVTEGEASWQVDNLIGVEYFIRVIVAPEGPGKAVIFHHDQTIQMFSHSKEDSNSPFEARDAPALRLLLGNSLHNNLQPIE